MGFAFIMLLSAFAVLTAIAFYLFDVRVTVAWQESSLPPPLEAPVPVSPRDRNERPVEGLQ
ncbi:MAG TPA: hypothetical protein VIT63_06425 [Nitrospira sp.]